MISFFSALAIVFHVSIDGEVKLSKSDDKVGFLQMKERSGEFTDNNLTTLCTAPSCADCSSLSEAVHGPVHQNVHFFEAVHQPVGPPCHEPTCTAHPIGTCPHPPSSCTALSYTAALTPAQLRPSDQLVHGQTNNQIHTASR